MRILVANSRSGAVRRLAGASGRQGRHRAQQALREALREAGDTATEVLVVPPRAVERTLRDAAREADELWVAGGDGTQRTAAGFMVHTGKPLGIVPLGTMNLLARDLGIPLDLPDALRALVEAPVDRIDVGRMDDGIFLNKSSLGLYPEMVIDRDRRRRLWGYGKWPAMLRSAWRALRRNRTMELTLEADGGERRRIVTPSLIVTTNFYEFRTGRLFRKPELCSGYLTAYVSHETSWMGSFGQVVKMFLGTLESDPELEAVQARRITIELPRSQPVANDGEVDFIRGRVTYSVDPCALAVRRPGLRDRTE